MLEARGLRHRLVPLPGGEDELVGELSGDEPPVLALGWRRGASGGASGETGASPGEGGEEGPKDAVVPGTGEEGGGGPGSAVTAGIVQGHDRDLLPCRGAALREGDDVAAVVSTGEGLLPRRRSAGARGG